MIVFKWFIVVLYGLLIIGNILSMFGEDNENEVVKHFLCVIVYVMPIIYILGI